ncbi:MAG TPA: flagellar basal body protein [Caulobacteraceae bacterium]|nr:flagellar basal body protein [Caulobacteraceae bacterium]
MALDAPDAAGRLLQLIALTDRLTALIAEQVKAFEAGRPNDAAARAEETGRLANLYRHESLRVQAQPELLAGGPRELRERLMVSTRAFDAVLARHGRAVTAAKTITEGLVRAIAEEIARQRGAVASYGPKARQMTAPATAMALNRRA